MSPSPLICPLASLLGHELKVRGSGGGKHDDTAVEMKIQDLLDAKEPIPWSFRRWATGREASASL